MLHKYHTRHRVARKFLFGAITWLLLAAQALSATLYVRSTDGSNSDNGSTWALAKATLAGAFTAAAAGDTIYVSDNHAETQASAMTLTSPGTAASPVQVICVDDSAEPPTARATTATISTTGTAGITYSGNCSVYGITFQAGDGSGVAATNAHTLTAAGIWWRFEACVIGVNFSAAAAIDIGASAGNEQKVEWINTYVTASAASSVQLRPTSGFLVWRDTPTSSVFGWSRSGNNPGATVTCRGVNLAGMGTTLGNLDVMPVKFRFEDCRLPAGLTISNNTDSQGSGYHLLINCDSADTNYRYHKTVYQGTITQETTIVRTGGATDGTTPIARKMVSTANSKIYSPLVDEPILVFCDSTSAQTVTVDVITDGVTLTNGDAWADVEHDNDASTPLGATTSSRVSDPVFGTPTNIPTDADSTWTTTGLSSPVEQEITVSFTPTDKGWFRVYVNLAKASTTMYYCPEVRPGTRQWMTSGGYINEGAGGYSRSRIINQ